MNTTTLNITPQTSGLKKLRSYAPWVSRFVMSPPALIFTLISIRFFTNPAHATPGVNLTTPEAFTDTRVMGAWMVTMLSMLLTCLASEKRLWIGHLELVIFMGVTLSVRIFGFVNDGTTLAMGDQRFITIAETVFLVLNALGLMMQARFHRRSMVQS